jgi:quercetin dioxygenase-like cupin family protein
MSKSVKSLLAKLPHYSVRRLDEVYQVWTLGEFDGATYELVGFEKGFYPPHVHEKSDARFRMLVGEGSVIINGKPKKYRPGTRLDIPKNTSHGFNVRKDTIMVSIQKPPIRNPKTGKLDMKYEK